MAIDFLCNKDVNEFLKEINFNLDELEKELEYNDCKIRIYNKTLLRKVEESQMRNNIFPNINNKRNELLNIIIPSNELIKIVGIQSKIYRFCVRDEKLIENNNNNDLEFNNKLINNFCNNQNQNNQINMQNNMNQQNDFQKQDKKEIENIENKEINEMKIKIRELNKKVNELEEDLKKEKDKNILLEQNIINLKKELNEGKKENKDLKKNIKMKNIDVNELNQIIVEKEKKINILEKRLCKFPFELKENDKLISVIFTSLDENFYYSIICKNTDRFDFIENKLYEAYSEYSKTENYFTVNGKRINKEKTLEYNKIKHNDLIILNQIE